MAKTIMQAACEQLEFSKQCLSFDDYHNTQLQADWLTHLSLTLHLK